MLFGALTVRTGFESSVAALIVFIVFVLVVARPAAIAVAFRRSELRRPERAFVAWLGTHGRGIDPVRVARARIRGA